MKKVLSAILCVVFIMGITVSASALSTVKVKSIALNKGSVSLQIGQSFDLKVSFTPSNTTQKILTYSTSNKKVAIVDSDGTIAAIGNGKAVITATSTSNKNVLVKCNVTVAPAPKVEIEVAAHNSAMPADLFLALFDGFQKAYPNVTVKKEVSAKIYDMLATRVASGDMPDIVYGGIPNGYDLIKQGKIMDFNAFFESKAYDADCSVKESLTPGTDEADVVNGKKYLIPIGPGVTGMVYNVKMFKDNGWKVPKSWDELLALSEQIKAKGITPIGYGALGNENRLESSGVTSGLMYQNGGDKFLYDLDNLKPGAWNSKPMLDSLNMLKEMVDKGIIDQKGLGMDPMQSQVAFLQGKYAMVISGYWFEMEMKDQLKGMDIGFMAFPSNKNGNTKQAVNSWFNGVVAWKGDPSKKEAVDNFMRYLLSYEFQKKLATDGGLSIVSNKRVMEEMATDPKTPAFSKAVAAVLADPNVKEVQQKYQFWYVQEMRLPFIGLLNDMVAGKLTPQQVADKAEQSAQKLAKDDSIPKRPR